MRLYFHLTNGTECLQDDEGFECGETDKVEANVLQTIKEARLASAECRRAWAGWVLEIVDDAGHLLFTFNLGDRSNSISLCGDRPTPPYLFKGTLPAEDPDRP
jgi:hypothetical protein